MAEVKLQHIEKIYPNTEKQKGAKKHKHNLKVTDEGVVAVEDFNLDIADKEFIVLVYYKQFNTYGTSGQGVIPYRW